MAAAWEKVKELAVSASELSPEARYAFLESACGADAELRREAESILACSDAAPVFLQGSAAETMADLLEPARAQSLIGRRVGAYELTELVAAGGMGAVYKARRADGEFEKTVAVKLLKHRLITTDMVGRLRSERQTLATLDHPNIAKLLDGGVSEDGLPYLVMEYVAGLAITRHCDEHRLTTSQRLLLFRRVAGAVQYAHQNLIVHRDLKPGNILVTPEGEPKLLDFGIAKMLSGSQKRDAAGAEASDRMMTPEYASPEQIRGEFVTTRSDVYSLGVILYEMLTGHRPYLFKDRSRSGIERAITEQSPDKPSTVITRVVEVPRTDGSTRRLTPELVSATREATPNRLRRRLAGDLDVIIMTALHKEPEQRYASVEQLSEDIGRHLTGLPLAVRRGSTAYRAARYLARNAKLIAAFALFFLVLVCGWIVTYRGWQAEVLARDEADAARRTAERAAMKAAQSNTFLQDMLSSVDPKRAEGGELTVRELLDTAAVRLDEGALDAQPEAEADVRIALGASYRELGLFRPALAQLDIALKLTEALPGGGDHPERVAAGARGGRKLAELLNARGLLFKALGRYTDAEQCYQKALAVLEESAEPDDAGAAEIMNNLGVVLRKNGRWEEAESLYREALDVRRRLHGDEHRDVATTMTNLAAVLKNRGEIGEAESLYRQALGVFRGLADDPLRVASCLNNLALLLAESGRHEEAEAMMREAVELERRVYGDGHPDVATGLHNLAVALRRQDKLDEAESLYRQALEIRREVLGGDHPHLAFTCNNLAELLAARGRFEEAERLCREALEIRERVLPEAHPDVAGSLFVLGLIEVSRGDAAAAEPALRRAMEIWQKRVAPGHSKLVRVQCELGRCLVDLQDYQEAESMLLGALESLEGAERADPGLRGRALQYVVELYRAWGRPEKAAEYAARE